MKVNIDFLLFLGDLYLIPWRTPNRLMMIFNYAQEAVKELRNGHEVDVPFFDDGEGNFSLTMDNIIKFAEYLHKFCIYWRCSIKVDLVLLPTIDFCCGKLIKIDSRYATILLYCVTDI